MGKMLYSGYLFSDLGVCVRVASFCPLGGTAEHRVFLRPESSLNSFEEQLQDLCDALTRLSSIPDFTGATVAFKRYYLTDIANQYPILKSLDKGTYAAVQQPPLSMGKLALAVYLVSHTTVCTDQDGMMVSCRNGYTHIYAPSLTSEASDTETQTTEVFSRFTSALKRYGCTLFGEGVRTWIFVRDIDVRYKAMVLARRRFFRQHGLSEETHFIASTGIEGSYVLSSSFVGLDAYAVSGLSPGQMSFLSAPGYMNAPKEYGVTFERGTSVDYGDRRHLYVSGTASIDHQGALLFPGDVLLQTARMLDNVQALLLDGNAAFHDVTYWLVYIRDVSDAPAVEQYFETRFPLVPCLVLWAPVCRPGWLIETECVAIVSQDMPEYSPY